MPDFTPDHLIALLAGVLPALFWLWFWHKQDKNEPEPLILIFTVFVTGMIAVPLVIPYQEYMLKWFTGNVLIVAWVAIEELFKYFAALIAILRHREIDEPIDTMIYMVTVALGFAALENTIYIFNPLADGHYLASFLTGNLRFLGSTLLHVLATGTVGAALAFAFYKSRAIKISATIVGLIVAIIIHATFNIYMMEASSLAGFGLFSIVWLGIIVFFLVFEKVKIFEQFKRRRVRSRAK